MILLAYLLGLLLLQAQEKVSASRLRKSRRSNKQYLFHEPVAFEEQRFALLIFILSFTLAWSLIYFQVLPAKATYDAVFGPVMVTGCWWFLHLFRNTHRNLGWDKSKKLLKTLVILWVLANIVDLAFIKLGAWNFSQKTTLGIIPLPYFLRRDVLGNAIEVPYVEILGFNLFIAWFILFIQMFINDLIKSPAGWKKLFDYREDFRKDFPVGTRARLRSENLETHGDDYGTAILRAAEAYDLRALEEAMDRLFQGLANGFIPSETEVRSILEGLRKKRLFFAMQRTCEVFIRYDFAFPVVLRQMAQALIDQGIPHSAPFFLDQIDLDIRQETQEWKESKGLLGRTYKQCYVDLGQKSPRGEQYLLSALEQYRSVYLKDKREYWHGINFVACVARGQRDRLTDKAFQVDWKETAREILASLTAGALSPQAQPWAPATCMEACVALDQSAQAKVWMARYVGCQDPTADVFEFSSTYRQLVEVWQLDQNPAYAEVLDALRQAILEKPGGRISIHKKTPHTGSGIILIENLEKAAQGLARVERKDGTPVGSAFLVSGISLSEKWRDHRALLITADHVLDGIDAALRLDEAALNFYASDIRGRPLQKLWSSPELDIAIFTVDIPGNSESFPVCDVLDRMPELTPNRSPIYILGHPRGGPLQINCCNNLFVAFTGDSIRYKTQAWPGSSGSPVLDESWRVIGVHTELSVGEDTHQGVTLPAIITAVNRRL